MSKAEAVQTEVGSVALYSQRCIGKTTPNEDAAAVIPLGDRALVLAVADGVGGLPQGEEAARIALETLVQHVSRTRDPNRLRIGILDAIEKANRRVLALGGGAGTTLAIAQIVDNRIRTYHVGDSEIFVIGGRGSIKSQTLAHGPVAYGVHCGLIDPAEALAHENRNLVSNVVGSREMRIEIGPPLKLAPRDLVLLCSDGITDNLHPAEIAADAAGKPCAAAAAALLRSLRQRRESDADHTFKDDDATLVVFRPAPASRPAQRKASQESPAAPSAV